MTNAELQLALRDRGTDLRVRADSLDWIVTALCPLAPHAITIVNADQDVAIEQALGMVDVWIERHYQRRLAEGVLWN